MKLMAVNGGPRKKWNTSTLLNMVIEGAASAGAQTELVHLYDLDFKGCRACYSCKLLGGKSYGRCAAKDELTPVLEEIREIDALVVGSPIYFWSLTGVARSFLERLLYPYVNAADPSVLPEKKIQTCLLLTMGASDDMMKMQGWDQQLLVVESLFKGIFGMSESLYVHDTMPYEDYSKYAVSPLIDPEEKARIRKEVFPVFCEKAFDIGVRFAEATPSPAG